MAAHYKLTQYEQATLLGFKFNKQRLSSLKKNKTIPSQPDVMNRVGNLMGIHKCLRILYPHNRDLVYSFLKSPWSVLDGKTPMKFIEEDPIQSFNRLFTIRRLLDQIRVGK